MYILFKISRDTGRSISLTSSKRTVSLEVGYGSRDPRRRTQVSITGEGILRGFLSVLSKTGVDHNVSRLVSVTPTGRVTSTLHVE